MKKLIIISIFFITAISLKAQQDGELGPFVGGSFYIGEINQSKVFHSPSLAYGVVFRHNFHERIAFRIEGIHTQLKASDSKSKYAYQIERNYSFTNKITDLAAGVEFNFLPYDKNDQAIKYFTPYTYLGLSFLIAPENQKAFTFAVPFGVGFKFAATKKISIGAEWTMRRTFTDFIDKIVEDNPTSIRTTYENKQRSYNYNKDWYSFAGVIITVQIFRNVNPCPAYK
jgi:hypothetical protein